MSFLLKAPAASTVFYANTDITTVAAGAGEFVVQVIPLGVGFFNGKTMRASIGVMHTEPFQTVTFRVRVGLSATNPALNTSIGSADVDGAFEYSKGFMLSVRRYNANALQKVATSNNNISYLPPTVFLIDDGVFAVAGVDTAEIYLMITAENAFEPCSVHTAIVERL